MTTDQLEILGEIRRYLKAAYDDYFKRGDGHCKSSEGYVEVRYPTYFDAKDYPEGGAAGIGVYSYVLGPSRMHDFKDFTEALVAVKQWHDDQLASEPER